MRNSKLFTATVVALSLALGGCASSLTGDTYSRDEARKVWLDAQRTHPENEALGEAIKKFLP